MSAEVNEGDEEGRERTLLTSNGCRVVRPLDLFRSESAAFVGSLANCFIEDERRSDADSSTVSLDSA